MQRNVCDYFWNEVNKKNPDEIPPIIPTHKYILIHIQRDSLYFLSVVASEVAPLLVLEFLHRVGDIFTYYFERLNENVIRENFVTVYQVGFMMNRNCKG